MGNDTWFEERSARILDVLFDRTLRVFVPIAALAMVVSGWRVFAEGWQPLVLVHLTLLGFVLGLLRWRSRLRTQSKTSLLALACAAVYFAGLLTYGRSAPGAPWFLACAITLFTIVSPRHRLAWILSGMIAATVAIAWLQTSGVLSTDFSPAHGLRSASHWGIFLISLLVFASTIGWLIPEYRAALRELLHESDQQRAEIARRAEQDPLTGLPSARLARKRIDAACARAARAGGASAVLFLDLDGFKKVNDTHGHAAGDFCLVEVAARIGSRLRGDDTAVRVGGDEFLVVLETVAGPAGAATLAQCLIEAIRQPLSWDGHALQVGASVGIALFPTDGKDADALVRAADAAMYAAKQGGRNRYCFSSPGDDTAAVLAVSQGTAPAADVAPKLGSVAEHAGFNDTLGSIRERIVDTAMLVVCGVLAISTVLTTAESFRLGAIGPVIGSGIAVSALAVLLLLRRRVPARIKAPLLCLAPLLVAVPGALNGGYVAAAVAWSTGAALVLVAVLGSGAAYVRTAVAILVGFTVLAAMFILGYRSAPAHFLAHAESPGRWLVYLLACSAFAGVVGVIWTTLQDVASQLLRGIRAQSEQLRRLADHDPLTGLPLLGPATAHLDVACRRASRADGHAAVLYIDLDGFKQVNDTLGHAAGDACLGEVARRLLTQIEDDDLAARIGGDEFMVVLGAPPDASNARERARSILESLCEPMWVERHACPLGASIGVAVYPGDGDTPDALRRNADAAMYAGKSAGKRAVVMYADLPGAAGA